MIESIVNPPPITNFRQEGFETRANILLVDDREDNLEVLDAMLIDFYQNLVRARSGQEALRLLLDKDFGRRPPRCSHARHGRVRDGRIN